MTQDPNADDLEALKILLDEENWDEAGFGETQIFYCAPNRKKALQEIASRLRALKGEASEPTIPNSSIDPKWLLATAKFWAEKGMTEGASNWRQGLVLLAARAESVMNGSPEIKLMAPGIVGEGKEGPTLPDAARLAGALFDFAGYLTSHPEVIPVGASAWATPIVDRLVAWAEKRGLSLEDADIEGWWSNVPHARSAPKGADLPAPGIREAAQAVIDWYWNVDDSHQTEGKEEIANLEQALAALHPQPRPDNTEYVEIKHNGHPMTWTKDEPKTDGWYWLKMPGGDIRVVTEIGILDGRPNWKDENNEWEFIGEGRLWAGPIPEPQEPRAEENG
jgi:hypothetical protein